MRIVEQVLIAEFATCRQPLRFDEALQVGTRGRVPTAATDDQEWTLRSTQHRTQLLQRLGRRRGLDALPAPRVGNFSAAEQHVFGQREHDRTHATAGRDLVRALDEFRDAIGAVDLRDPLRHRPEHAPVVDLLECFALDEVAADLADEQDHRRRILKRGVHADGRVGRARPARHEADAGRARELAVRFGHVRGAALVTTRDQLDALARAVQGVEHRQVAFAGHAEREVRAVNDELIDENLPAGALHKKKGVGTRGRDYSPVRRRSPLRSCPSGRCDAKRRARPAACSCPGVVENRSHRSRGREHA